MKKARGRPHKLTEHDGLYLLERSTWRRARQALDRHRRVMMARPAAPAHALAPDVEVADLQGADVADGGDEGRAAW